MRRIAATFLVVVLVLFALELSPPGQDVIGPWTAGIVKLVAAALRLLDGSALAAGMTLVHPASGFAMTVLPGCNGVEATLVLAAAMIAYPAPLAHRACGLAAGLFAIQGLNLVRIASLFYLGRHDRALFEWAHLYGWQALIMLDALFVWILWLRTLPVPGTHRD